MLKKLIIAFAIIAAAIYSLNTYIESQLNELKHSGVYDSCKKVWSARGLYSTRDEENTLTSIARAEQAGAQGIEIDFFYYPEDDRFYVSHDKLKRDEQGNFIDGEPLTLEAVFKEHGNLHYWLDYKNVGRLSDKETLQAISRLTEISSQSELRDRLYIEGSNPLVLGQYTRSGFKTILAMDLQPMTSPISEPLINLYKMVYYFSDITAVASRHGALVGNQYKPERTYYDPSITEQLSGIPYFLFHTPDDQATLDKLANDPTVRVMLVGRDQSINRFNLNACQ